MIDFSETGILSFDGIYALFDLFLPAWLAYAAACGVLAFIVINAMVLSTALYVWFERRTIGRFQSRLGPNRWGPFGLLQPFADVIKLIVKEDTTPATADKIVFALSPIILFAPTVLTMAVIPFGEHTFLGRLNVGVLFLIGVTSLNTVAVLAAGFASRNKYAMLGSMRGVAMLCSYEVPMALSIVGVVLIANSLSLYDIVQAQSVPFLLVQPLGFLVFMAAASAEMSRTPFDQIEAESELGAGYHTEYSGMKFAIFQLAEFMAPIVTSVIAVALFFGGTRGFDPIPRPGLVRHQGRAGPLRAAMGARHLAQAAYRPDYGVRVEGTFRLRPAEHLRHSDSGYAIPERRRGNIDARNVDNGCRQLDNHHRRHLPDVQRAGRQKAGASRAAALASCKYVRDRGLGRDREE